MKRRLIRALELILAGLLLSAGLVACGEAPKSPLVDATSETIAEKDMTDYVQLALDELGEIDWEGKEFTILCRDGFADEIYAENMQVDQDSGASQVINDAVYERNSLFEDRCHLVFKHIPKEQTAVSTAVQNEAAAPTGDFILIDQRLGDTASLATAGYLADFLELDIDLDGEWWDSGTAEFILAGGVYFMSGSLNTNDDGVTYVLIFNKDMQKTYENTVPNPYDTVRSGEWTLAYFNTVIQGISADNGDGKWDEKDTYGFLTNWEYGNTFFIGSDLRYINNTNSDGEITLFLSDKAQMEKALSVLELSQSIYHNNNASYMSPAGQEPLGIAAFKENRGLFFGEVVNHLSNLTKSMETEYGILPVPKYDKAQEFYRTWTHPTGSTISITSAYPQDEAETIGMIIEAYAILSHQYLKPAYYDVMLTSRSVHDVDSAEMMDLMFSNRVYELSFYFIENFGFFNLFKTATNDNADNYYSKYAGQAKAFERRLDNLLITLERVKK